MTDRWFRRLLAPCPMAVLLLWIAGVARFREYRIAGREWLFLAVAALGLDAAARGVRRSARPPVVETSHAATVSAVAAAVVGVAALLGGGLLEFVVERIRPTASSLPLRALWHGACAFAFTYCTLLLRLTAEPPRSDAGNSTR